MDQNSEKRISIARIFAAAATLEDTIAACATARRSSQEAMRVLEILEYKLRAEANVPHDLTAAIAQAKAHLARHASALKYAATNAEAVAKTMRFDAA
jgi:hypothetical protein